MLNLRLKDLISALMKHPHADVNNYTDAATTTRSLFIQFSAASALDEVSSIASPFVSPQ